MKQQLAMTNQAGGNVEDKKMINERLSKIASMANIVQKNKDMSMYGPRYSNASGLGTLDYGGEASDDNGTEKLVSPGPGSYLDIYKNSSFKPKT